MARLFISHSSRNDEWAIALRDWLVREGWSGPHDIFLDLDPERGIAAGQRWADELRQATNRCEAVLFLLSEAWLGSTWCRDEYQVSANCGKKLFALLVDDTALDRLPSGLTTEWQVVRLRGEPAEPFLTKHPHTGEQKPVHIAKAGLASLKRGLDKAGIGTETFDLQRDPTGPLGWRAVYRGLEALEPEDAAVFFGRNADIVRGIDALRMLAARKPPRLMVVLGASGAGKSSFLRAGLWPRLKRDDSQWLPLRAIRAGRGGAIEGGEGLLAALEEVHQRFGLKTSRSDLRKNLAAEAFVALLGTLRQTAARRALLTEPPTPLPILCLDQGEELFSADAGPESARLLALARAAVDADAALLLVTIRSDSYGLMQSAPVLAGIDQQPLSLGPVPQGEIARIIREPAELLRRVAGPDAPIFDPAVVARLQEEIAGEADALPLLAFVLQRLMREHAGLATIGLAELEATGGVAAAIESEAEKALDDAGFGPDRAARREALHRLFIPRLARIDRATKTTMRRVSPQSALPLDLKRLAQSLTGRRLLVTRLVASTEDPAEAATLEVAHEALLRRWPTLVDLLAEDRDALLLLDGLLNAAVDWTKAPASKKADFIVHLGSRLTEARGLATRGPDWAREIGSARLYLSACEEREARNVRRHRFQSILAVAAALVFAVLGVSAGLAAYRWSIAADHAQSAETLALERLRVAQIAQSRALASTAESQLNLGNPDRAVEIALEALPSNMEKPDRPYVSDAEVALHKALRAALANELKIGWQGATGPMPVVAISPHAKAIAAATGPKVELFKLDGFHLVLAPAKLPKGVETENVRQVRFLPDDRLLIIKDHAVLVYDLDGNKFTRIFEPPAGQHVCGWNFTSAGRPDVTPFFAPGTESKSESSYIMISNDLKSQSTAPSADCVPQGHEYFTVMKFFERVAPSKSLVYIGVNGTLAALTSIKSDSHIKVMSPGSSAIQKIPDISASEVSLAMPSMDGNQFLIALKDGRLLFFRSSTLRKIREWPSSKQQIVALDVSSDSQRVLVAYADGKLLVLERQTSSEFQDIEDSADTDRANLSVCAPNAPRRSVYAPDEIHKLDLDSSSIVLSGAADAPRYTLGEPDLLVRDATFSADGREAIVLGEPKDKPIVKVLLVYDAASGQLLKRSAFEPGVARQCARVSSDKETIALADPSYTRIANVRTDEARDIVAADLLGLAFSPKGDRVLTYQSIGLLIAWDVATGEPLDYVPESALVGTESSSFGMDRQGKRILIRQPQATYAWTPILDTQALIDAARRRIPGCVAPNDRVGFYLSPEPPDWCIEIGKGAYATPAWKQWLASKMSGRPLPMPSSKDAEVHASH